MKLLLLAGVMLALNVIAVLLLLYVQVSMVNSSTKTCDRCGMQFVLEACPQCDYETVKHHIGE